MPRMTWEQDSFSNISEAVRLRRHRRRDLADLQAHRERPGLRHFRRRQRRLFAENLSAFTYSLIGGWRRKFSETLEANLALGARRTTTDQDVLVALPGFEGLEPLCLAPFNQPLCQTVSQSQTDWGAVVRASVNKRWGETTRLRADFDYSLQPNGNGDLTDTANLKLRASHSLSARLSGTLRINALYSRVSGSLAARDSSSNRDVYQIVPGLSYALTEDCRLNFDYRYTWRRLQRDPSAAESNAAYVTLTYNWPRISISR